MGAVTMRIDFATLAFGYQVTVGGATPNWGTSLGQGRDHRINDDVEIDEILKGITYSSVSAEKISTKLGKGGAVKKGSDEDSPIVLGAVFSKVYINDILIENGRFVLIIVRDLKGAHAGRLKLKYGPGNAYTDGSETYTNDVFFSSVKQQFGWADDACWFVSNISIRNQDELILKTILVNPEGMVTYADSTELHNAWHELDPLDIEDTTKIGENIIFYGVPGSGKSFTIRRDYCDDENYMERVVFHPDYTYSDFIGQILPQNNDGHISYSFIPGPFTRIMGDAESDPYHNYYLVIEEINRGNAPAIFGEVFQLLDRTEGVSDYGINNEDIARVVYHDPDHLVKIPKNLFLLATMNTSDQNVFTLDTAFKRRWLMKHIENNIDQCDFADNDVCGSGISWETFAKTINKLIIEVNAENLSNEDNRLGAYFVKLDELKDSNLFGEKVLMYLWNDAFKYDHERVFRTDYRTLDELIDGFKVNGLDVFVDDVKFTGENVETSSSMVVKEIAVEKYLEGKKEHLVAYYNSLRNLVKEKVPNSREASTGSLQYAAWRADDIKKSSFADLQIQSDRILIYTETPKKQEQIDLGEIIPKDGHHNHYFKIIYSDELTNEIADIIIESYEQLKEDE